MGSCFSAESRSPLPNSPTTMSLGVKKRKNSRKRPPGSRSSSFDHRREEQLHRIVGRMFLNGSSEVASLFTQQGKKGTNQDAMIVWENFGSRTDTVFCGVFDGHGPLGHMVAKRVRDSLPLKLSAHWEVNLKGSNDVLREIVGSVNSEENSFNSVNDDPKASTNFEEIDNNPEIFQTLKDSFLKAFKVMDRELSMYANADCFCSGTTAVTLIKQGQHLIIGNIGDSRAVLCTRDKDNSLVAVQLTIWDVLTNEEVINIVASAESHSRAAQAVVESAVRAWRHKFPTSKVDDCAVVCLFLGLDATTSATKWKLEGKDVAERSVDVEEESSSGKDWSALEGVSRLNTLLTLPRFVPGEDEENHEPGEI
ncbi:Protein phosphatase 2C [Cynara cardunculus var. scolymus]|uniref:Protein phosphatase 2C n=1 Tax=Cynara cardunculus var. scolymus TaxID=59895 RepID=A0A103YEX3_CYNCS|nr:Protein phosphatase 2C [Cynara cardunculus var. scolymus]